MRSEIKKVILNGKPIRLPALKETISAMRNDPLLVTNGGSLFSALIQEDMPLIGFVNANRSITLIFKPTPRKYAEGLNLEEKSKLSDSHIRVTRSLLIKTGIVHDAPSTVKEPAGCA